MNINYYAKNYEIGNEVKKYIEERVEKFRKYINPSQEISAEIKLEKTKHQNDKDAFQLNLGINIDSRDYSVEKTAPTAFQAVDECESALNSIIKKEREKFVSEKRRNSGIKHAEIEKEY